MRELAPDIAIVQEAPRLWRWRAACARLAREAALVVVTGGRPAAGNLLLCAMRVRVLSSYDALLPKRPGLHRRGAVVARLAVDGAEVLVMGTHLDLDAEARRASAVELRRRAGEVDLVGADVNDEPGSPAWQGISVGLQDAGERSGPTFSVRSPQRRIDGLFVAPRWEVTRVEVVDCPPVTDHRPVVADLRLRGSAER